jgi:hypothetical protein
MKGFYLILVSVFLVMMYSSSVFAQEETSKKVVMHRYMVERTFPNGLEIPVNMEGSKICLNVVSNNAEDNVNWVHSYVTMDHKKTFCIYDAPSPDAIRKSAKLNGLPVDNITEVSVLDPFFYK